LPRSHFNRTHGRRKFAIEGGVKLRPATPADLHLLRSWNEQAHVIASDPNDDWGWEVELVRNPLGVNS
jgi:hypothetical protein